MAAESPTFHSAITDDRQDAIVRFVASTLLSLGIASVVLRLVWIRHPLRSLFGKDDLVTVLCAVRMTLHKALATVSNSCSCPGSGVRTNGLPFVIAQLRFRPNRRCPRQRLRAYDQKVVKTELDRAFVTSL